MVQRAEPKLNPTHELVCRELFFDFLTFWDRFRIIIPLFFNIWLFFVFVFFLIFSFQFKLFWELFFVFNAFF